MMSRNFLKKNLLKFLFIIIFVFSRSYAGSGDTVIDVWYGDTQKFGHLGNPQQWVNILGNVSDPDGIVSLTYSLNGGPELYLSIGPDNRRLASAGDFAIEIDYYDLLDGANQVDITVVDGINDITIKSVIVNYSSDNIWPQTYIFDWDTVTNIQNVSQIVDGLWTFGNDGIRPVILDYDRLVAVGDIVWTDYEIILPITLHGIDIGGFSWPSGTPAISITLRWRGHTDWDGSQPRWGYEPVGAGVWYVWNDPEDLNNVSLGMGGDLGEGLVNGKWAENQIEELYNQPFNLDRRLPDISSLITTEDASLPLLFEVPYIFKLRVETVSAGVGSYKLKYWQEGISEPVDWDLTHTESINDLASGCILFIAHHVDVTFGDVSVIPLPDMVAPTLTNVNSLPGGTDAKIFWRTNELSSCLLYYGLTTSYELGSISPDSVKLMDNFLEYEYTVHIENLSEETEYHYKIAATDWKGNFTSSGDLKFTTKGPSEPSIIVTDEFDSTSLDTSVWTFINPLDDAEISMTGNQAAIFAPSENTHDVWGDPPLIPFSNTLPRIMQEANDVDFEIQVKFDSGVNGISGLAQQQGILVAQDSLNLLRFEFFSTGQNTKIFSASFSNGEATVLSDFSIGNSDIYPLYLRIKREDNQFTLSYSFDSYNWTSEIPYTFGLQVQSVGVYAGNSAGIAQTALIDYFYNTADGVPFDTLSPVISEIQVFPNSSEAMITWKTDELATSRVDYGLTSAYELGFMENVVFVMDHSILLTGLSPSTEYHFSVTSVDGGNNLASSPDSTFSTEDPDSPSIIQSDLFSSANLNTNLWTFIDPLKDANVNMTGNQCAISVSSAYSHDIWGTSSIPFSNTTARIMQNVNNVDFEIIVKFDSDVSLAYQQQGIIIEQDENDLLRLEFLSDGINTNIFAATFADGIVEVKKNSPICAIGITPLYMKVKRISNQWQQFYSLDGINWTEAIAFYHNLFVTSIGLYAGNSEGTPHTALFDYFYNEGDLKAEPRIYLEGPYISAADSMITTLLENDHLPQVQPYSGGPWNYSGPENVMNLPNDVVDWILVELCSDPDASSSVASRTAFVKSDGQIVDMDGQIPLRFSGGILSGSYYLVLHHRNHLSVMSANPLTFNTGSSTVFDFTEGIDQFYGSSGAKQLETGVWGMYGGDGNADGGVFGEDYILYQTNQGIEGYLDSDFNLDGGVFGEDYIIYRINQGKQSSIP